MAKITAMSFVGDDLKTIWENCERFAGPGGRIATMPDIIAARVAAPPSLDKVNSAAWDNYHSTSSAEYAGVSKAGVPILIVAHGIGPMAKLKGVLAAYKPRSDEDREGDRSGQVSRDEFLKLESGHYGAVEVVELAPFYKRYQYPFLEHLTLAQCKVEPLVRARLGPQGAEYIEMHEKYARACQEEQERAHGPGSGKDPSGKCCILELKDSNKAHYAMGVTEPYCNDERFKDKQGLAFFPEIGGPNPKYAFAHLLSIGQPIRNHLPSLRGIHLVSEVGLHSPSDHCRFMGVQAGSKLLKSHVAEGLTSHELLRKHWKDLMVPVTGAVAPARLRKIEDIAKGACFTQTLKTGKEMDTSTPEFFVRARTKIKDASFRTKVGGYYGFLRYSLKEVEAIAPPEANAYELGDTAIEDGGNTHFVNVTFFKAEIDYKRRIMTHGELNRDHALFVRLSTGE